MNIEYYVNRIKLELTGGVLQSEIDDAGFKNIINLALQDLNRYYDQTALVQSTAGTCIDLAKLEKDNNIKIGSVAFIYRANGTGLAGGAQTTDPVSVAYWNMAFGSRGIGTWAQRYMAYNTSRQIMNTLSTDLAFKEDKAGRKLYVNYSTGDNPGSIAIEYIPRLDSVDDVVGDFWVEVLNRLSLAYAKIALGRIRTRFTQSNALWAQDGETLLNEGKEELAALRERLNTRSNYMYPVD